MLDRRSLFHDMTLDYMQPAEPDAYSEVTLRLRVGRKEALQVFLNWNNARTEMKATEHSDNFDFYTCRIRLGKTIVAYYFEILSEDGNAYYDRRGMGDHPEPEHFFRLTPGFRTPGWARGAVFYQIFTDRFYNGDTTNDVLTDEYQYVNGHTERVTNWRKNPETANDIRQFYGGDLQGVLDKMDYLQDLGVDVIYFNPLFCSPSTHKYDTQDYDHIDPHFGVIREDEGRLLAPGDNDNRHAERFIKRTTSKANLEGSDELFRLLIADAHKRGMRVIIDGVFNHCGSFNKWLDREQIYGNAPGYQPGAYVSENSPYHDFFAFHGGSWPCNSSYEGWWGYDTLPKLNYEASKDLYQHILDVGRKWVSAPFFADGWRLDVAADLGHSEEFNHRFWKDFRQAVKEANPDAIILAEHYGDPRAWLQGDEWDTVMNYDCFMEPVTWFLTGMEKHSDAFYPENLGNSDLFYDRMVNLAKAYFNDSSMQVAMNELSNHDHSRFLTRTNSKVGRVADLGSEAASEGIKPEVMREAVVIQMTWPGAPTLYYGDEVGVCGFTDPDNRRTYPWGEEDLEILSFYKGIIRIHKQFQELRTGSLYFLFGDYNVLAYGRFNKQAASVIMVNNNDYIYTRELDVKYLGIPDECEMRQVISTNRNGYQLDPVPYIVKDGKLTLTMPGRSAAVVRYNNFGPIGQKEFWDQNVMRFDRRLSAYGDKAQDAGSDREDPGEQSVKAV